MFSNIKNFAVKVFFTLYAYVVSFIFSIPASERQAIISLDIRPFMSEPLEEGFTRSDLDFKFDFTTDLEIERFIRLWGVDGERRDMKHSDIFAWHAWNMGVVRASFNRRSVELETYAERINLTRPVNEPFVFSENHGSPLAHNYLLRSGGTPCQRF